MNTSNPVNNAAKEAVGKVKEGLGTAIGNDKLRDEGRLDQVTANVKQAAENVKDAAKKVMGD